MLLFFAFTGNLSKCFICIDIILKTYYTVLVLVVQYFVFLRSGLDENVRSF